MTPRDLWNRYCQYFQFYPEAGLGIDISRMRFPENFLPSMETRAQEAFFAMEALENGAIANPDELRMVGHYWLRTPALSPTAEIRQQIESAISRTVEFAARVHRGELRSGSGEKFKNLLVLGIGGSALGPQLVADALWSPRRPIDIYFGDNTDPDGFSRLHSQLHGQLDKTLCVVISKSGGTPETRNGQIELAEIYQTAGLDFAKHAVAITSEESKLDSIASSQGWLDRFPMWDWVGGRTSLFSTVGLIPAALLGVDIQEFIAGGRIVDQLTRNKSTRENPAMLLALMWYFAGDGKGKKDMVILPYRDRLVLFSKYLQQLVMESLGKERDLSDNIVHQGIAVYGNKGSTDQHAYIQQLRDGLPNFFATFIEVLSDTDKDHNVFVEPNITSGDFLSGFLQGTRRALYENGRDSITLTVDTLDAHSLGALIALYDRAVGFYASLVNINAYHQPGVEAGKKAASQVIDLTRAVLAQLTSSPKKAYSAEELSIALERPDDIETVFKILEHLAAHPSRKIRRSEIRHPAQTTYRAVG